MERIRPAALRLHNRLLAQCPAETLLRLTPHLTAVTLRPRQVLQKQAEPIRHVYFPTGGIVSMATVFSDGAAVEAATVGSEGMVGVDVFYSPASQSSCEAIVQVSLPGGTSALKMPVTEFRHALDESPMLHDAVARYAHALYERVARLTACNARHDVHQRCARWLLAADDHVGGREFHLSQEFLAVMLGVRRQTVSVVVSALRGRGLIRYVHGKITILDRRALARAACECYPAIARTFRRLRQ